jgi:carboxymethylenebutenolidase
VSPLGNFRGDRNNIQKFRNFFLEFYVADFLGYLSEFSWRKVMQIEQTEVLISTPDGQMSAFLAKPKGGDAKQFPLWGNRHPAVLLLMEAFGLTSHIREVATRIAQEGYVVLTPDLYYRELPPNKFGYDEVEQAMTMMWNLDFGQPMEQDIRAALDYLTPFPVKD